MATISMERKRRVLIQSLSIFFISPAILSYIVTSIQMFYFKIPKMATCRIATRIIQYYMAMI